MNDTTYGKLTSVQQALIEAAAIALETAYNPYSHFYVGCALLTSTGEIISASNVENAVYGSTICAERMALGKANSMGRRDIVALAVVDIELLLAVPQRTRTIISAISELLPLPFGPNELRVDITRFRPQAKRA